MNEKIKELLRKFSKEEIEIFTESLMDAENPKALIEKVKAHGIDLLENEAEELYKSLKKPFELSDNDLDKVAGGGKDSGHIRYGK